MSDVAPGLREQKRRATERALQLALLRAALARGSEGATVEDACREAGVSARTFFNYFPSKEDALTGRPVHFEPSAADAQAFVEASGDVIADLVDLVTASADEVEDRSVHQLRRELLHREPHLLALRIANAQSAQHDAVQLVQRRLDRQGATLPRDRAQLVVLIAMAALRFGWMRWVSDEGERPLRETIAEALTELRSVCADAPVPV